MIYKPELRPFFVGRPSFLGPMNECKVLAGPIATGGVLINNAALIETLNRSPDFRSVVGGEMEAWGLYQAVTIGVASLDVAMEWIVVKGICDWGFQKTKGWQPLAAAAASDLVFTVLSNPDFFPNSTVSTQGTCGKFNIHNFSVFSSCLDQIPVCTVTP